MKKFLMPILYIIGGAILYKKVGGFQSMLDKILSKIGF